MLWQQAAEWERLVRPAGWVTFLSRKAEWELTDGEWEEELSRWKKHRVQICEGRGEADRFPDLGIPGMRIISRDNRHINH